MITAVIEIIVAFIIKDAAVVDTNYVDTATALLITIFPCYYYFHGLLLLSLLLLLLFFLVFNTLVGCCCFARCGRGQDSPRPVTGRGTLGPARRGSRVQAGTPGKLRLIIKDNYPAVNNYSVIKV